MQASAEDAPSQRGLGVFFAALGALALLRIALSYVRVAPSIATAASVAVTIVFLVVPVLALYKAASARWTAGLAAIFLLSGLVLQFGLLALVKGPLANTGLLQNVALAFSQTGLVIWCVGLGALLTTMLKDKNLLIPVAIFLALFDLFAVFTPVGPVQVLMRAAPQMLPSMAYQAPAMSSTRAPAAPAGAPLAVFAYVGPADFLFMGMFFVAVFRFNLRTRDTFKWMLIALACWIALSAIVGEMPLLVPIGLAVLLVNLPEFKLNKEEWMSTGVIAALMTGVVIWGATRPRPPVRIVPESPPAPSSSAPVPGSQGSAGSPGPASPSPRPSASPLAPKSAPSPP